MLIRTVQPQDIETLFDIRTSVVENYQSRAEIAQLGITPDSLEQMLQQDCKGWLVELDGQVIGFSIADRTQKTIVGIFVRPAFENRGAGRILMQAAETWLWSHNIDEIWLLTGNDPKFRAYGFYLHLGWLPAGTESEGTFKGEIKFVKTRLSSKK